MEYHSPCCVHIEHAFVNHVYLLISTNTFHMDTTHYFGNLLLCLPKSLVKVPQVEKTISRYPLLNRLIELFSFFV